MGVRKEKMLKRFSLYGFLKNQRYDEPFLILALLQMGLNFTWIGVLIAFKELSVNFLEIPSGAVADLWGRRRSMMLSFISYILYFLIMGLTGLFLSQSSLCFALRVAPLFTAMFFCAFGDAFRTGTHKAMIFTWLRMEGRISEKTKVYGYTRSWSKIGSAVSVVVAAFLVYFSKNYIIIFFFAIIPYILSLINFAGYPAALDGESTGNLSVSKVYTHLKTTFLKVLKQSSLRRLIIESMGFEGFFRSFKDYLQPILKHAALPLTALLFTSLKLTQTQKSVILIGPVYFVLFLLSAFASRNTHKLVKHLGTEKKAAHRIWIYFLGLNMLLLPSLYFGWYAVAITGFVIFYLIQNLWRPVLISRFDALSNENEGATVLSIESQAKSLAIVILAPTFGFLVDHTKTLGWGQLPFWPLTIIGVGFAILFLFFSEHKKSA